MVRQIELSNGKTALVDDTDWVLDQETWFENSKGYAICNGSGSYPYQRMHRIIMKRILSRELTRHELVDHKNGNPLDNRRDNLRLATNAQNQFNRDKNSNNTTGFKGVYRNPGSSRRPFVAKIMQERKSRYLGSFPTAVEAAQAYDQAAIELAGQFARGNF